MKINRRKYPRIHEDIIVDVEFGDAQKVSSHVIDVSLGGVKMRYASAQTARPGQACQVTILDQPVCVSFSVAGEIAWFEDDCLGIKFTEISSDARRMLNKLIADLGQSSMQGVHTVAVG